MKFLIKSRNLPSNQTLLKKIDLASTRLYLKLKNLDVDALHISEYIKNYFTKLLVNLKGNLQKYSYLMSFCLFRNKKSLSDFTFVEYGGGSGLFSLLAKEIGIGTVIYNDIYDVSCHDSKKIANSIGNTANEYICGEIREIIDYFKQNSIQCDALGSNNVIEHIYDINDFLHQLTLLSENRLTIVLGTGTNPFNPIKKRMAIRLQNKREFINREKEYGHKERDTLRSYAQIRKEMIIKYTNKKIDSNEVYLLVQLTRGLIEDNILKCVEEYIKDKVLPIKKDSKFPTNSCDPYTGNWEMRLMDPYELSRTLEVNGFYSQVIAGSYEFHNKFLRKVIGILANKIMNLFPRQAIYLAPYYILYGYKN